MVLINRNCFSSMWAWASDYVRFSEGAVFMIVLGDAFLDNAFSAFLISYIQYIREKPSLRNAAAFVNAFEGLIKFMSIIIDHIAFDRIGYFKLLICTVPALIVGLLVLWLSSWLFVSDISNRIFYIALTLLIVGIAAQVASLYPFLCDKFYCTLDIDETETIEDQFSEKKKMDKYEETLQNRADFWKYIAVFLGTFTSSNFASSLAWKETFMVSLIIVGGAYLVFCSGKHCYDRVDPAGQTVASRLKQAKPLLKLLPLWITFIVYSLVEATGSDNLDDWIDLRIPTSSFTRIPLTSFYVLQILTSFVTSLLSDFLIKKIWSGEEMVQHRAKFLRIWYWNVVWFWVLHSCSEGGGSQIQMR